MQHARKRRRESRRGRGGICSSGRLWGMQLTAAAALAMLCTQVQQAAAQAAAQAASASDAASATGAAPPKAPSDAMRRSFLNATDPLAVCNDGSPGVAL